MSSRLLIVLVAAGMLLQIGVGHAESRDIRENVIRPFGKRTGDRVDTVRECRARLVLHDRGVATDHDGGEARHQSQQR